jgi:hypothetical protein
MDHVEKYMSWAKGQGHDPDEVSTLKKYGSEPGVGRSMQNRLADEYLLMGDDWRGRGDPAQGDVYNDRRQAGGTKPRREGPSR